MRTEPESGIRDCSSGILRGFVPAFEGHLVIKSFTLEWRITKDVDGSKTEEPERSLTMHHGDVLPFVNLQSDPSLGCFLGFETLQTPQGHQHKGDASIRSSS